MIVSWVDIAVEAGARREKACRELGLDPRTLERWRAGGVSDDGRRGPRHVPKNKLTASERAVVVPWGFAHLGTRCPIRCSIF